MKKMYICIMENKDSELIGFMRISLYAGMREDLVQAGGGNTSAKISDTEMIIKASGCQLSEISENYGWCKVNSKIFVDFFSQENPAITQETEKQLIQSSLLPPPYKLLVL